MDTLTNKKILITGAPRAATKSTAIFLQELGVSIGHEKDMGNGTVSSLHTNLNKNYDIVLHQIRDPLKSIKSLHKLKWVSFSSFSEIPDEVYDNDKLLMNHLTLTEINILNSEDLDSMVHIRRWKEIMPIVKDTNLTRQCMKAWLEFNIKAEISSSWCYKVEDLSKNGIFKEWIEKLGIQYKDEYFEKYKNSDSSKEIIHSQLGHNTQNPPLTWEILKELDLGLTNKIITYANQKGYNI